MALAVILAGAGVRAWQVGTPQFRARTDLIQVDVSVIDRSRQPVRGLTAVDFSVTENGKPQRIEAFTEIDLPAPVMANGWLRGASDIRTNDLAAMQRLFVLVLDDAIVPFDAQMIESVKQIGRATIERLGPADLCAVVHTWDTKSSQGFTDDKPRLLAAVSRFVPAGQSINGGLDQRPHALASIDTLSHLADVLATVHQRRKTVLWVSVGSPMNPQELSSPTSLSAEIFGRLKEMIRRAERANVNVFGIDPGGLDGLLNLMTRAGGRVPVIDEPNPAQSRATDYREFLQTVAENTGGRAFVNSNEFTSRIEQVLRETGSFYLLGYQTTSPAADGRLRRIDVKVNRPNVQARARRGYYAAEPPTLKTLPVAPASVGALSELLPATDLPMRVATMPFGSPAGSMVALAIGIESPNRVAEESVDLVIKAFTPDGIERSSQRLSSRIAPTEGAAARPVEILTQLLIAPGRYELRIGASMRHAQRSGSVYADLDVPDFHGSPFSLSGVVVAVDPPAASGRLDAFTPSLSIVPTTRRTFQLTERVTVLLRIYQGRATPPVPTSITATINDGDGAVAFRESRTFEVEVFGGAHTADYLLGLPIAKLSRRDYQLTIIGEAGRATARRDLRFTVR